MFRKDADFETFERVMVEAHQRQPIRVLSYCVMSNRWHFVEPPFGSGSPRGGLLHTVDASNGDQS